MTTACDVTQPLGSDAPSVIDNEIRDTRAAFSERLDNDHVMRDGNDIVLSANGGGKHRQITFYSVLGSDPTPASGEGLLYSKDVGGVSECFYIADGVAARQITSNGVLHIIKADILNLIDGETLYWDGSDQIAVQLDDDTLEYDATAKVRIKVPASTGDDDGLVAPVMAYGHYNGNGAASREFDTGINIRYLVIKCSSASYSGIVVLARSGAQRAWKDASAASADSFITVSGTTFTTTGDAHVNSAAYNYMWYAIGERP